MSHLFKSHRAMRGKFPALKMGRMISFDSLIERDYLYLLDYDSEVVSFTEQPFTIAYKHGSKTRHYTPDFHVVKRHANLVIECKPKALLQLEENQIKFKIAFEWCEEQGWEFYVVTEQALRRGHRLSNIKLLTRYARQPSLPDIESRIYAYLLRTPSLPTLSQVATAVAPDKSSDVLPTLLKLAYHHKLLIPLDDEPITEKSFVMLYPVQATEGSTK